MSPAALVSAASEKSELLESLEAVARLLPNEAVESASRSRLCHGVGS